MHNHPPDYRRDHRALAQASRKRVWRRPARRGVET
jgi:hypothetical protein